MKEHKTRIEKVRYAMADKGIDVFLLGPSSDMFYLTGYGVKADKRLFFLVLPREGSSGENQPFVLANLLYREQVSSLPSSGLLGDLIFWKDGEDPFEILKKEIEKRNIPMGRAALEASVPALFTVPLGQKFPETEFVLGSSLTEPLRQYKDESELEIIKAACRESDRALAALMDRGSYWLGKSETDFYNALQAELGKAGLGSFGAGIAAGANAAVPHHSVGPSLIENGKCFLVDFWAKLDGYFTDCTRTFFFGKPDSEFEKIHAIVLEAQSAAQEAVAIGKTLGDVDYAARSVIEKAGYGEYFTHRTGHGCGIDIHEGDSVNIGVDVPLAAGMVFSIEPGIYLPGRYGVRIENLVAVTERGAEVLHAYPRDLKIV